MRTVLNVPAQQFFGLKRDPFAAPRCAEDVYLTPQLRDVYEDVIDSVDYLDFRAVVGPVGCGKSVLRQYLQDMVARNSDWRAQVIWPAATDMRNLNVTGIESIILEHFGESVPSNAALRRKKMERVIAREHKNGQRITLAFDEAHDLTDRTLLKLKDFYELGSGFYQYVGLLMFGQTQLFTRLKNEPKLTEIFQRLEFTLVPRLSEVQAWEYVAHRVHRAGGKAETLIDRSAVIRIAQSNQTALSIGNSVNGALQLAVSKGEKCASMMLLQSLGYFGEVGEATVIRTARKTA